MRAVAESADVALGTLYRYFPSKIHLLGLGALHPSSRCRRRCSTAGRSPVTPGRTG